MKWINENKRPRKGDLISRDHFRTKLTDMSEASVPVKDMPGPKEPQSAPNTCLIFFLAAGTALMLCGTGVRYLIPYIEPLLPR